MPNANNASAKAKPRNTTARMILLRIVKSKFWPNATGARSAGHARDAIMSNGQRQRKRLLPLFILV